MKTTKKGLSLQDLKKMGAASVNFDALTKQKGVEQYSGGGAVLSLAVGEAVRGTVSQVNEGVVLDKKYDPINIHVAQIGNQTVKLPAATSFRDKAAQAGLNVGDEFAVRREADYLARGKMNQGYSLVVIKRGPNGRWTAPGGTNGTKKAAGQKARRR